MRRTCSAGLLALTVLAIPAFSQEKESSAATAAAQAAPATKLESFLSKRGVIFIRDYLDVGKVEKKKTEKIGSQEFTTTEYWISITALAVYEPGHENKKTKGLQCSVADFRGRTYDSGLSFLDIDEAESLSKALQYLIDLTEKWKGQDVGGKEVFFTTKGDFKVGFTQEKAGEAKFFVSSGQLGRTFLQLPSVDDVLQMKTLIDSGIDWLKRQ